MGITADDRLAIQDLLAKYAVLMDLGQSEEWLALFDEPSTLDIEGRPPLSERDQRRELADTAPRGVHLASAPVIVPGSSVGAATATQTFTFRNRASGELRTGWYEDELVKRDGTWLFKVRRTRYFDD